MLRIFVQSCPGLTLNRLLYQIKIGKMTTTNFRLIILYCGTNDVHSKTDEKILDYSETIIAFQQKKFVCKIAVSAIIQRLCDDEGPRLQILTRKSKSFANKTILSFCAPIEFSFMVQSSSMLEMACI